MMTVDDLLPVTVALQQTHKLTEKCEQTQHGGSSRSGEKQTPGEALHCALCLFFKSKHNNTAATRHNSRSPARSSCILTPPPRPLPQPLAPGEYLTSHDSIEENKALISALAAEVEPAGHYGEQTVAQVNKREWASQQPPLSLIAPLPLPSPPPRCPTPLSR